MPYGSYTYRVDLDGDNDWYDSGHDISAYVMSAGWQLGMNKPYDTIARSATLALKLRNTDKRFSPESGSAVSGFKPGRAVRVEMTTPSNQNGTYVGVTKGATGIADHEAAVSFDGVNDYINVYDDWITGFVPTTGWFACWYKVDAVGTWTDGTLRGIARFGADANNLIQLYKAGTGEIVANYIAGGTTETITSAIQSSTDYQHLFIYWVTDGPSSSFGFVLNGVEVGNSSTLGTWSGSLASNLCVLGALNTSAASPLKGYMAHPAISSSFVPAGGGEVETYTKLYEGRSDYRKAIYNTPRTALLAYWPLGDTGTTTEATNEITQRTMFTGRITEINPTPGAVGGNRQAEVVCEGYLSELMGRSVFMAVQQNKRGDEIVRTLIESARVYPPGTAGWFAGVPGYSEAGVTTIASGGVGTYTRLERGATTFVIFGDNINSKKQTKKTSVYSALKTVVEAEQGKLFETRTGRVAFWSRHTLPMDLANPVDFALTDVMFGEMDYKYGRRLMNDLTLTIHPRTVSGSVAALGTLDKAVEIGIGEEKEITINFLDSAGNRQGGIDLVDPVATTDYLANTAEDGSGTDVTASFSVSMEDGGDRAKWTVSNASGGTAYLLAGSQQRGKAVSDLGDMDINSRDETSILEYRLHSPDPIDLKALEDASFAQSLADYMVYQRKDPRGEIESVTFIANRSAALLKAAMQMTIGDRITISETQTGASGGYYIVGEKHELEDRIHQCTWFLEPVPQTYWLAGIAGYSNAGVSTRAGL
jgi:hypothetical protein